MTSSADMPALPDPELDRLRRQARELTKQVTARDPMFSPIADLVFHTVDTLGRGGMGTVYRVEDRRLGRHAALKLMHPEIVDQEMIERFLRESLITARLDHPSIPPVYDAGTTSAGQHFLLMKCIEGETLDSRIRTLHESTTESGGLRSLLEAFVKVGEAVAYAHARGIIHRDLKPSNVMLGHYGEVMVMDWGLARDLSDSEGDEPMRRRMKTTDSGRGLTDVGVALGTPGYMAPEQARGRRVDERADVFALGAILLEILTGEGPIDPSGTSREVLDRTVRGEVRLPAEDAVPEGLGMLLQQTLEPNHELRTLTAFDLVLQLRAWLRRGAESRTPSTEESSSGVLSGLLGVTSLVLLIALGMSISTLTDTREALTAAHDERIEEELRNARLEGRTRTNRLASLRNAIGRRLLLDSPRTLDGLTLALAPSERLLAAELEIATAGLESARRRLDDLAPDHPLRVILSQSDGAAPVAESPARFLGTSLADAKAVIESLPDSAPHREELIARFQAFAKAWGLRQSGRVRDAVRALDGVRPPGPAHLALRAWLLAESGRKKDALETIDAVLVESPGSHRFRRLRRDMRLKSGDLKGARRDAERLVGGATEPQDRIALANLLCLFKQFDKSELQLRKVLSGDPKNVEALRVLVAVLDALARERERDEAIERLAAADPTSPLPALFRASGQLKNGKAREAVAALDRLIEQHPGLPQARLQRGVGRLQLGNPHGALADLEAFLRKQPRSPIAWFNLAVAREQTGDLAGSKEAVAKALEDNPNYVSALAQRGHLLSRDGNETEALTCYNRVVQLAPEDLMARQNRAIVLTRLGRVNEALVEFRGLMEKRALTAEGLLFTALCLERLGQREKAVQLYQKALPHLRPEQQPDVRRRIHRLSGGGT